LFRRFSQPETVLASQFDERQTITRRANAGYRIAGSARSCLVEQFDSFGSGQRLLLDVQAYRVQERRVHRPGSGVVGLPGGPPSIPMSKCCGVTAGFGLSRRSWD